MREEFRDWLIIALTLVVILLATFAGTLIDQVPAEECMKEDINGSCKIRAIIWDNHRWMEIE